MHFLKEHIWKWFYCLEISRIFYFFPFQIHIFTGKIMTLNFAVFFCISTFFMINCCLIFSVQVGKNRATVIIGAPYINSKQVQSGKVHVTVICCKSCSERSCKWAKLQNSFSTFDHPKRIAWKSPAFEKVQRFGDVLRHLVLGHVFRWVMFSDTLVWFPLPLFLLQLLPWITVTCTFAQRPKL